MMTSPWDLTPAQRLQIREAHAEEKRRQMERSRRCGKALDTAGEVCPSCGDQHTDTTPAGDTPDA